MDYSRIRSYLNVAWGRKFPSEPLTTSFREENFDFNAIGYYALNKPEATALEKADDRTLQDLDFKDLFVYLDRTSSRIGQQFLYDRFLYPYVGYDFEKQERTIDYLSRYPELQQKLERTLAPLNTPQAYYLANLLFDPYIQKPKRYPYYFLFAALPSLTLLLGLFNSVFFFVLVAAILINVFLHYRNKKNLYIYQDSISQLLLLITCNERLIRMEIPGTPLLKIKAAIQRLKQDSVSMQLFRYEKKSDSEMMALFYLLSEYVKIFFLLEPLMVFNLLDHLDKKRDAIRMLFDFAGEMDLSLSILKFRTVLPYYCKADIDSQFRTISVKDLYHPMVPDCIPNSLKMIRNALLLTGSNMSGKSTFIRMMGLSVLCGQSINTCFAKYFTFPPLRVFSAIRIADSLEDSKSYYFDEVLAIREMVELSGRNMKCLFLLDEIFKGTNTIERVAAGKAVLSYLGRSMNHLVFASTHDVELTHLLNPEYELYHFTEVIHENEIQFDYKLKEGPVTTRNAIDILRINGYPAEIIQDANRIAQEIV